MRATWLYKTHRVKREQLDEEKEILEPPPAKGTWKCDMMEMKMLLSAGAPGGHYSCLFYFLKGTRLQKNSRSRMQVDESRQLVLARNTFEGLFFTFKY